MGTQRYLECLALVLHEETSYPQRPGGPYVRKVRRQGGRIVATAIYDEQIDGLIWSDRTRSQIPTQHDGCAYDDDPHDTGGRTCMGILQREYDAFRRGLGQPTQDVWRITDREIEEIFEPQYWTPLRCGEMPAGVDYFMVDFGFACGIGKAAEKLQRTLGVKVDRHIGVGTLGALRQADAAAVVDLLSAERDAYYKQCRTYWKHGKGWLARNRRVTASALGMVSFQEPAAALSTQIIEPETPVPSAAASRDSGADKTVATSKTVQAAIGSGGVSGMLLLGQINQAAAETKGSGLLDLLARLAGNPTFVCALVIMLLASFIFRERLKKIVTEGV
jgi:lysozyme family protein